MTIPPSGPASSRHRRQDSPQGPDQERVEVSDPLGNLWLRLGRFGWEVLGMALLAFALMTLLGLVGLTKGTFISYWAAFIRRWFGWGSPILVLGIAALGMKLLWKHIPSLPKINLSQVLALELSGFSLLAFLALAGGQLLDRAESGKDGGLIGWGLGELIGRWISAPLSSVLLIFMCLLFFAYGIGLLQLFIRWLMRSLESSLPQESPLPAQSAVTPPTPIQSGSSPGIQANKPQNSPPRKPIIQVQEQPAPVRKMTAATRDQRLPPINLLLQEQAVRPDEEQIRETALLIEQTLADFGVPARVVGYRIGPTITQYAVEPGYIEKTAPDGQVIQQKVRVAQISQLSRDLAMRLSTGRLRIEAPVPGRAYVGIEVPNSTLTMVRLRPLLESEQFHKLGSPLAIVLGRDVSGQAVVADLARMPHLLVAGTTGSGKSVCVSAIAACLLMNNTPADLRMVLLDPKMVELARFNGFPHLIGKAETEVDRMLAVLRWATMEMDHRYRVLESAKARDIDSYNRKMEKKKQEILPRIVIIIDELADLMMKAPEQTERNLVRLAQMARATGIHLVVATQRPSTDVVTGLIKTNFPARIAFTVATAVDSRVILDMNGAETLLGRGDMLFLNPESGVVRAQGLKIEDQEVERIKNFWKKMVKPAENQEPESPPWDELLAEENESENSDALIDRAVELVRSTRRASVSLLQRRLRVGYPRAARLIDELEEMGIVGPSVGSGKDREVLIPPQEEEDQLADNSEG
ncbi:MAG TPA: DNA translocase FtsK [Anaerolineaceae bacterium]